MRRTTLLGCLPLAGLLTLLGPRPGTAQKGGPKEKTVTNTIHAVAISPDGKRIVTLAGLDDGYVWDSERALEPRKYPRPLLSFKVPTKAWSALAFIPGTSCFLTDGGPGRFKEWDARTGRHVATHGEEDDDGIHKLALSKDGKLAVLIGEGRVKVWDIPNKKALRVMRPKEKVFGVFRLTDLALSPDGKRVLAGSNTGHLYEWDLHTGKRLHRLGLPPKVREEVMACLYSPDGAQALVAYTDSTIRVWGLARETVVTTMRLPKGQGAWGMALSPDGKHLVTGDDEAVRAWDWRKGTVDFTLPDYQIDRPRICFSQDGRYLVLAGGRQFRHYRNRTPRKGVIEDRVLIVWDWRRRDLDRFLAYPYPGQREG
jgi:WD40 repeat protein